MARLAEVMPILSVTAIPAVVLLAVGILLQPNSIHPPKHRDGVRCTRILRQLAAERARQIPRPRTSPLFTVQPREVVS